MVGTYRLVTRSDFDGLVCAVLLRQLGMIDAIEFAHPKDVQDGRVPLGDRDITTNLPYVPGVHLSFDHHSSEALRVGDAPAGRVIDPHAPSAARVVYDHFGGAERFPLLPDGLMAAVDKADAARFSRDEITDPSGWVLLNYLMDPRTGLGRFREFRISNYALMMQLVDACLHHTVEEILALPDVAERVTLYRAHEEPFHRQVERCVRVHGNVAVLDLRAEETIYAGNRFAVYALFPRCDISVHALWGRERRNTVFAVGKSILNRTSTVDVGEVMLSYGGGGHDAAGTCQVDNDRAHPVLGQLIRRLTTVA